MKRKEYRVATIKYSKHDRVFLRHIMLLSIIYLLTNWFMLVISGRWWDDWGLYLRNVECVHEAMMQQGLPLEAYLLRSVWWLPHEGYRIVVFALFWAGSLLLYCGLRRSDIFAEPECFWITALYITVPINTARLTLICYGYSVGLFSFWLAFYLTTRWYRTQGYRRMIMRAGILLLLIFSYNTESVMAFTLLILMWLYYMDLRGTDVRGLRVSELLRRIAAVVFRYIDFLAAPVIFYFGKRILFPCYGSYDTYNYVDWRTLPGLAVRLPLYLIDTLGNVIDNYAPGSKKDLLLAAAAVLLGMQVCVFFKKRYGGDEARENNLRTAVLFALGAVFFAIGALPYIAVRKGGISAAYVQGRDSLLLGTGIAFMAYYGVKLFVRERFRPLFCLAVMALGAGYLNRAYLDYQKDWYYQLQFQAEIAVNEDIQAGHNLLCIFAEPSPYSRYYQLNGNSYAAIGSEDKLYLQGTAGIPDFLELASTALDASQYLADYDFDNKVLDGIVFINNAPISDGEALRLRWQEIFDRDGFMKQISDSRDIEFAPLDEGESEAIIRACLQGELTDGNVREYLREK